jgi:hypothetical protein
VATRTAAASTSEPETVPAVRVLQRPVKGELAIDPDSKVLPIFLELPGVKTAGPEVPVVDAVVPNQLFRVIRRGMRLQVSG